MEASQKTVAKAGAETIGGTAMMTTSKKKAGGDQTAEEAFPEGALAVVVFDSKSRQDLHGRIEYQIPCGPTERFLSWQYSLADGTVCGQMQSCWSDFFKQKSKGEGSGGRQLECDQTGLRRQTP